MENCGDISSRKRRKPYIRKLCLTLAMLAAVGIVWLIISVCVLPSQTLRRPA